MYTPSTSGGHALYTLNLLSALASANPCRDIGLSLFTCSDLPTRYRVESYPIYDALPPMKPLGEFKLSIFWNFYRQYYFYIRERKFLQWAIVQGQCRAIHFQEYTPWLMYRHFERLQKAGLHLFYTVHGVYPNRYMSGIPKTVFHKWCRNGWRQCDGLFVHTDGLRRTLLKFLGKGSPPVFVTPFGVSDWLPPLKRSPALVATDNPRRLLFFGVIRPTKGLDILLRAMRELPEFQLTIAGDFREKSYKKKILSQITHLPVYQVHLIDRFIDDDEIPGIFAGNGMAVLPYTFFYGQSGALAHAMEYGLPVVASDVGGLGESVRKWKVGRCVAPDDPKALAEGIRMAAEPAEYWSAKAAIEKIRDKLKWKHTAEITWDAYRSVLNI